MVAVLILTILAGLTMPALFQGRRSSFGAVEISNLRQIGQAALIYEQTYGDHPLGTRLLVQTKLIPPEICSSPLDDSREGLANLFVAEAAKSSDVYATRKVPYKNSFTSFDTMAWTLQRKKKYLDNNPSPGWLVSLAAGTPAIPGQILGSYTGRYRRLLMDGSVKSCVHHDPYDFGANGNKLYMTAYIAWYIDVDELWIRRHLNE